MAIATKLKNKKYIFPIITNLLNLLDKNSKTGIAIYIVAEIFERRSNTSGNNFIIVSLISTIQMVKEFIDCLEQRGSVPVLRVRVFINAC